LEDVMREELDALIGVAWGESSPKRKGYRNGSSTRESFDDLWSDRRFAGSKTTVRASSIPRSSSAIEAQNRRWPKV
jgi:hypothetical protein